jgi:transposase
MSDTKSDPSNVTGRELSVLEPLIPPATPGGRLRKTDMREAMNAIFYLLRTGCPWCYLPRDGFPARSAVDNIFRKFQREGTWEAIWEALYQLLHESEGREASPKAGVIESQTLKSAEKGVVKPRNQPPTHPTPWDMTQARR